MNNNCSQMLRKRIHKFINRDFALYVTNNKNLDFKERLKIQKKERKRKLPYQRMRGQRRMRVKVVPNSVSYWFIVFVRLCGSIKKKTKMYIDQYYVREVNSRN